MKTIIINLKTSSQRRETISGQLDKLGLEYEFFDAVDGSKLGHEELSCLYNKKWAKRHVGRSLLSGEIGCALSHLGVYRKMLADNLPFVLVLEDDAQLAPAVVQGLEAIEQKLNLFEGFVCLLSNGANASIGTTAYQLTAEYSMAYISSAAYSAYAYVISQEGAKRMISELFPVVQVADHWSWISRHTSIKLYICHPAMASHTEEKQWKSTIANNTTVRGEHLTGRWKSWVWWRTKIYCKWWRLIDRVGLGYYFWKTI